MNAAMVDLTRQHPDFVATAAARTMGRDFYEGDEIVKSKGETYLPQNANEQDADYDTRLARAALDPLVNKIIGARQALLFSRPHTRALLAAQEPLRGDVDRKGTSASTFMAEAVREAQIDGIHWILVDVPALPVNEAGEPVPYASRAAEKAAGHRPFFSHVPATSLQDWETDDAGELLWAVISATNRDVLREPGGDPNTRRAWHVWSRENFREYEEQANGSVVLVRERAHPLGKVPVVAFGGEKRGDFSGWPVCRPILPLVRRIYNLESDLDWFQFLSAHPIPYVIADSKPQPAAGQGLYLPSKPNGPQTEVGFLETTGRSFESLQKSIADCRASVLSAALGQDSKPSGQVQSADSIREDRRVFTQSLKAASMAYEKAEERCWQLWAAWESQSADGIEILWSRDFDDKMISQQMVSALSSLAASAILPPSAILQVLIDGELLPPGFDIEAAIEEAEEAETRRLTRAIGPDGTDQDAFDELKRSA